MSFRIIASVLALVAVAGCEQQVRPLPARYFPMAATAPTAAAAGPADDEASPYRLQH